MDYIFLPLYRWIVMPAALVAFPLAALLGNKKISEGLKLRFRRGGPPPWLNYQKNKQPAWIHCSSGEFEYARDVLRKLKQSSPETITMVTYFSPTYKSVIEKDPNVDFSCPLPWDFPGVLSGFLNHHNPQCLMIARTDLWPELLTQCKRRKIPTLLFSATQGTCPGFIGRVFKRWLLDKIDSIHCVSEEDFLHLSKFGSSAKIEATGDTRYDQAIFRVNTSNPVRSELFTNFEGLTLLCGSTWFEDEKVLVPAIKKACHSNQLRVVITPHEPNPDHLRTLEGLLDESGLSHCYYSKSEIFNTNVLVVDKVGVLADLYKFADLAFIGGSFKKTVHSVMEGLVAGLITIVGPKHQNNREALQFKKLPSLIPDISLVHKVEDFETFSNSIDQVIKNKNKLKDCRTQILDCVDKKKGASQKVIQWLESI